MTIMQVGIVACLGVKKAPGRSAMKPQKDLLETVLSRRVCLRARAKRSFPVCQTIVKMKPTERARRTKTWALESPHLELRAKSYSPTKSRDQSVKESLQTGPLLEKQKAQYLEYVYLERKCTFGQGREERRFLTWKTYTGEYVST